MSRSEQPQNPYAQVAVFRDTETSKRVAVSLLWVTRIQETDTDTVFTFLDGSTQSVQASFDAVTDSFAASIPAKARRR